MTSSSDILTSDIMVQAFELNPDLKIINIYGLTEAGRACYKETTKTSIVANAVGRASVGVEITLDKIEGELGEIIIRGPNVMLGYLDEIIEDRIIYKPCTEIHTGDLAYYDKNGDIILVGRRDHMINIRGIKIHPAEIETLALQSPGIIDAVARTAANDEGDLSITLDVVFGDDSCDMEVLRNHLRKNLPPHFFPRAINSVSQIKRTELGSKIVRR
jgi:acyl-CoA synthetase (AMP-forming)/AMP-acid ligase II